MDLLARGLQIQGFLPEEDQAVFHPLITTWAEEPHRPGDLLEGDIDPPFTKDEDRRLGP